MAVHSAPTGVDDDFERDTRPPSERKRLIIRLVVERFLDGDGERGTLTTEALSGMSTKIEEQPSPTSMSRAEAGAGDDMAYEIKGEFGAGEPG